MKKAPKDTHCVECGVEIYTFHDDTIPASEATCEPCELEIDNPWEDADE